MEPDAFGMFGPMLPMILNMVDDETLDTMSKMMGETITEKKGYTLITGWNANEEGDDYLPEDFIRLVLGTLFDSVREIQNGRNEETL